VRSWSKTPRHPQPEGGAEIVVLSRSTPDTVASTPAPYQPKRRRVAEVWQRSPVVPAALKNPELARQLAREATARAARSPITAGHAVARGAVVAGRSWWRWVNVADYRSAAAATDKLADSWAEIHRHAMRRRYLSAAVAALVMIALVLASPGVMLRVSWLSTPLLIATVGLGALVALGLVMAGPMMTVVVMRRSLTAALLGLAALVGLNALPPVLVVRLPWGAKVLWGAALVVAAALAIAGRRRDGSPGRKPILAGPRSFAWTMDPQILVDAFRDARLIGKDETLRLVERAQRQGQGWAVVVDLPATRKAADVIKGRDALASALAVDEVQLIVERVRGKGGHAGRVSLWVADEDPYAAPPVPTPLRDVPSWDAWAPGPFGIDARGRRVDLPLVWTSLLVGAIPRQGKTFATRLAAAGLVLDPYARLYVWDGKGGKDWRAAELIAHRFMSGDETWHAEALRDALAELVSEVQGRYGRMAGLPDSLCPESKITPELSRNTELDMPITVVIIDEVQVYLTNTAPVEVDGKKVPLGQVIAGLLEYLAKKGPAAGVIVILATQRPDAKTIPAGLRAVLGSRFALRVMDWRDSNIILGDSMNTRGYDSSRLLASHKGVGILRPDGDIDTGADVLALTVRTFYMPNEHWREICERGRALREAAGTLTGHAAGAEPALAVDSAAVARALTVVPPLVEEGEESVEPDGDATDGELADLLTALSNYLDTGAGDRDFIPTAELIEALDLDPVWFGRAMGQLGCRSSRKRCGTDGAPRRGYLVDDLREAVSGAGGRAVGRVV
jgi:S-DNA-T family DNA segregation ATPase FtsK/SpoIIIE